ncbi:MAG: FAD-dependent monooxygenase [Deltaproteobacteria bacterium]|nr:FAD-dependent monooxygenase [Deltaproteobacteria bacterium]MBK8713496.1 FAD-dependent monooxygenase [Deltaproteobacteria bacterium]
MSDRSAVDLQVHPDALLDAAVLRREAARAAKLRESEVREVVVLRKAIDARHGKVRLQLRVAIVCHGDPPRAVELDSPALPNVHGEPEVIIVGAGPAGMFCAWALTRLGIASVVLERGKPVRARRHDLAALTQRGVVDPDSNYCFGEGGAGTFSDGKLYTRADKRGEVAAILRALVRWGAPPEIVVDARPHIGTNRLPAVIGAMRAELEDAGVRFCFEHRAAALRQRGGAVVGLTLGDGTALDARAVVLAPGHSARDVQQFCAEAGVVLEFKPFALGVRVEHPQPLIDRLQYGALAGHPALGSASYRLVERAGAVGVFSFCMCPGGFIVPAATAPGEQVVNGWSPSSRRGRYANSGFVVEVGAETLVAHGLSPADPLAGVELQRRLEQRAFVAGGGGFVAPAQRIDDFVAKRASRELPRCSYPRGVVPVELDAVLGELARPLREAMARVGSRMRGFAGGEGIAVALESRTSCPVRIVRDAEGQSPRHRGLYPCAEGAGYAGGIMSAALDGVRTAVAIATQLGRDVTVLGNLV